MMEFIGFTWVGLLIAVTIAGVCYVLWQIIFNDKREGMSILFFSVLLSVSIVNLYGSSQFYVEDTVVGTVEGKERDAILSGRSGLVDVYMNEWKAEELVGKDVGMICTTTIAGNYCDVKTVFP